MKNNLNLTLGAVLGILMTLTACSGTSSWDEEIRLNDGRTITIEQWRKYASAYDGDKVARLQREARIRFKVPELGNATIEWQERLYPIVLNVHGGKWYIVGMPNTGADFDYYKRPRHTYVPFRFENGKWERIPFKELPKEVYQSNLWLGSNAPENSPARQADRDAHVRKMGSQMSPEDVRIDPAYLSVGVQNAIQSNWQVTE